MRKRSRTISKNILFLLGLSMVMSSCFEKTEACLDSNATNFDVYADENCCCTYPSLNVNIIKQVDGEQKTKSDLEEETFTNALGQQYQIVEQSFYISEMTVVYSDGSHSNVLDTLLRPIPADADVDTVIEDNFGLVRQSSASYSAGSIKENGSIVNVNFIVGLTDEINMLVPDQLTSAHALGSNNAADHYIEGEGYVFIRWIIKPIGVAGVDEINVSLTGSEYMENVSLSSSFFSDPGAVTQIPLVVDYGKWLQGIDFADDQATIDSKIAQNTVSAFSIQ